MRRFHAGAAALLAVASVAAGRPAAAQTASPGDIAALARAREDSARRRYTPADVAFMSAMIGHHAQAITMAQMAPTHGASPAVRTLAERIIAAQRDEIATMQQWLRERGQPVPDPAAHAMDHAGMDHAGMDHMAHADMAHAGMDHASAGTSMPGMLTAAQLRQLDQARGEAFDRLFLTDMIQHHRGAVSMVTTLFGTYGAGQDESVFKFASDVNVDQTTEIARMERMLADLVFEPSSP